MMRDPRKTGADKAAQEEWDNEGGGLKSWSDGSLPPGIATRTITEYCIGPYRYTDRLLALAEWRRQSTQA